MAEEERQIDRSSYHDDPNSMKNTRTSTMRTHPGECHYEEKTTNLDSINKQLMEMRDRLLENIYKVHLLQVDLATQFNPNMVQRMSSTEMACDRCAESMEERFSVG